MNRVLERIREISLLAWVRFVQVLNAVAMTIAGSIVAIDAMYHNEISAAIGQLPPLLKILGLGVFGLLVHYGLRRAKKAA